jgi:hypothetical protein
MMRVLKLGLDLSPDSSPCTLHGHVNVLAFVNFVKLSGMLVSEIVKISNVA